MRRRPELCAAPWSAACRVGTLAFSYPRAGAPCLRPASRLLVETNWTTTRPSSGRYKWRRTACASSFETLSPRSSTGAPWPSTEKRCLTNSGNSANSRHTSLTGHPAERAARCRRRITWATRQRRHAPFARVRPDLTSGAPSYHPPLRRHVGERGRLSWPAWAPGAAGQRCYARSPVNAPAFRYPSAPTKAQVRRHSSGGYHSYARNSATSRSQMRAPLSTAVRDWKISPPFDELVGSGVSEDRLRKGDNGR